MTACRFLWRVMNTHRSGVRAALFGCYRADDSWCHVQLLPSQRVLCTPYNHAACHVTSCKSSHIHRHRVPCHACLAVTCHLHFWQNDRDLLRAGRVLRYGYRNKSQHRKSTLEKKSLPPLLPGLEPEFGALTTEPSRSLAA